ncbi:MAG: hypothetical protein U9R75_09610 [Candidatus Thermoplasmatota archaeon]|nr:hypothetical protein [Candidatus Thermoplasmatota archaeon]
MSKDCLIQVRVNAPTKKMLSDVASELDTSISDLVRMMIYESMWGQIKKVIPTNGEVGEVATEIKKGHFRKGARKAVLQKYK